MRKYDDILHLSHPVSERRARMPLADRAAQFSPFAALTGYDGVIEEAGRITEPGVQLDESVIGELNTQLNNLQAQIGDRPAVTVTYFLPDSRKDGGSCRVKTGTLKKIDVAAQCLLFTDGAVIPFAQLLSLQPAER